MEDAYATYDEHLLEAVGRIRRLNTNFPSDPAIIQAPVKLGGLGIPFLSTIRAAGHAAVTLTHTALVDKWLGVPWLHGVDKEALDLDAHSPIQQQLSQRACGELLKETEQHLTPMQLATLVESASRTGSVWLKALPLSHATTMTDFAFAKALQLRCLVQPDQEACSGCLGHNDFRHAERCPRGWSLRTERHEHVKWLLYHQLQRADRGRIEVERGTTDQRSANRTDIRILGGDLSPDGSTLDIDLSILTSGAASMLPIFTAAAQTPPDFTGVDDEAKYRVEAALTEELEKVAKSKENKYAAVVPASFSALIFSNGGLMDAKSELLLIHLTRKHPSSRNFIASISCALQTFRSHLYQVEHRNRH